MTNELASAHHETQPVKPVTNWENKRANGLALCDESIFRKQTEHTQSLRDRQAAYLDSLPSDPSEVIKAALKLIHPKGENYPDGFEEALHLSYALEALVKDGDLEAEGRTRDAALYVADRVAFAMHRATKQLDRVSYILGTPGRMRRDQQDSNSN